MFLGAIARRRYDETGTCIFNGMIGIWPFTEVKAAIRSSKNRQKGTLETKQITVTKNVYLDFMVRKAIPAIRAKWPKRSTRDPIIQQDNAGVHNIDQDKTFQ